MKDLHDNYIKILKFEHPEEPIKKWVIDHPSYIGEYHSSWEHLMPIVEKIESLNLIIREVEHEFWVDIYGTECDINDYECGNSEPSYNINICHNEDTKIKSTYKAVVHFIDWYNKQH